jgi:hypothetical protein
MWGAQAFMHSLKQQPDQSFGGLLKSIRYGPPLPSGRARAGHDADAGADGS